MEKRAEINAKLKETLKSGDKVASSTIRLIMAAMKDRDISAREHGNTDGISDDEILLMLQSMVKQRQESSQTYSDAGRDDLAEREQAEIDVIKSFMPRQLEAEEVEAAIESIVKEIDAKDIKDMGRVMAVLKERYAGQVDMGKAGGVAKKKLA